MTVLFNNGHSYLCYLIHCVSLMELVLYRFSGNNHTVRNMEFSVLHWMGIDTNPNSTKCHRDQELFYIWAFPILHPAGINIFVSALVSSECTPYPGAPNFFSTCFIHLVWKLFVASRPRCWSFCCSTSK